MRCPLSHNHYILLELTNQTSKSLPVINIQACHQTVAMVTNYFKFMTKGEISGLIFSLSRITGTEEKTI